MGVRSPSPPGEPVVAKATPVWFPGVALPSTKTIAALLWPIDSLANYCIAQYRLSDYFSRMNDKRKPTNEAMGELQTAYDFFNRELFGAELPQVLLTLQRKSARVHGYFSPERFSDPHEQRTDELAMNPMHFHNQDMLDALATLAHEMVHVWQAHLGKPGRSRYHNKEWGSKMKDVGLYPSNSGAPGGKETGDQMTHYVIAGGRFERSVQKLLGQGFRLSWGEPGAQAKGEGVTPGQPTPKDKSNRVRFFCPSCSLKAWAKPKAPLMCGICQVNLVASE